MALPLLLSGMELSVAPTVFPIVTIEKDGYKWKKETMQLGGVAGG